MEKIKRAREKDEEVVRVVKEIKRVGMRNLRGDEQKIEKELVLKEGKMYVSKDKKLRIEVIQLYHDILVAGHEERQKTMKLVARSNKICWKIYGRM